MSREDEDRGFVLGIELWRALLLGEVDVAENLPAGYHGRAQKRPHWRVVGREADVARIVRDALQAQGLGIPDENAQDPLADRERSDCLALLGRDAGRDEVQEPAVRTDDSQGSVSRIRQFDRQLDDPLQHYVERQVRGEDEY